ncbi:MAG: YfjI family protein [Acidithiobacillus sp.]|nr:YfjI family protein [Acidithiobacillus sp.]
MVDLTSVIDPRDALDAVSVAATEWPTPERIGSDLPSVPQMDVEMLLPAPLAGYVRDAARRKVAPAEFVAVSLLVSLGALIGARCGVRPKLLDDWIVVPNLWGAIIAPPSKKKSPSMADGTKPLKYLAAKAREKHAKAMEAYQGEVEQFEIMMAAAKKAMAKAADAADDEKLQSAKARMAALKDSRPQPPTLKRYTSNDATIEKLGDLLVENPQGLLTERDELAGLLTSFDKSGHESDRAFYLEAWNGTDGHEVDRIARGSLYIPNLALSVLGGIQPERLEKYLDGASKDVGNDGLLARFQLMVWPDDLGFVWRDTAPDKGLRDAVYKVFETLDDDDFMAAWGAEPADQFRRIPSFKLSPAAAQAFIAWDTKLQTEIVPSCQPVLQEHFGKYEKLVAGLALILDMAERADAGGIIGPIREGPMLKAIAWADFLGGHAKRVYHLWMHPEVRSAQRLSEFLVQRKLPDPFTTADIQRKGWSGLGSPKQIGAALEFLESVGWVRPEQKPELPGRGRPSKAYTVNPKIHRLNANEEPIKPILMPETELNRFSRHSPSVCEDVFTDDDGIDFEDMQP